MISGYPTGGWQPALSCQFVAATSGATTDYTFNPASTTNRLEHVQQVESMFSDGGVIILNNNDRAVPDLRGYHVDLGWGLKISSGTTEYSYSPRMWVTKQTLVSGGNKNATPNLYSVLEMKGVWSTVLNVQPIRYGVAPYFRDESEALANQTIVACMSTLIGGLNTQIGAGTANPFSLVALTAAPSGDDGIISSTAYAPFPLVTFSDTAQALEAGQRYRVASTLANTTHSWSEVGAAATAIGTEFIAITTGFAAGTACSGTALLLRLPFNENTPVDFETYGTYFRRLLQDTKTTMRAQSALAFKIMFAQTADAYDKTYYSSTASGHAFYEAQDSNLTMMPNYIEVRGYDYTVNPPTPTIIGKWVDSTHWSGTAIPTDYIGSFMPVVKTYTQEALSSSAACSTLAETLGRQLKSQMMGGRLIIPMDIGVEIGDRVKITDLR